MLNQVCFIRKVRFVALATFMASAAFAEGTTMEKFLENQALVNLGETSFQKYCSGCHGVKGDAATASQLLDPKPRNLTSGTFKFRSTPVGALPTDADLERTIRQGVPNSSMPSFANLPDSTVRGLVAYIKTLSPVWQEPSYYQKPTRLPEFPEAWKTSKSQFLDAAKKGRKVYAASCALCHGPEGRGDGPSAEGMTDEWDQPIQPANLSIGVKGGPGVDALIRGIGNGLSGTPMAGFYDALGEKDFLNVVAYVFYLRGEAKGLYPKGTVPAN